MVLDRSPDLDRVFHALAHPARRAILRRLSSNEQNLSELAAPMRMSFPAASKHVRVLEKARLVRRRVVGRSHLCRLDAQPLKGASEWMEGYRKHWEAAFGALDDLLARMQADAGSPAPSSAPSDDEPLPDRSAAKPARSRHAANSRTKRTNPGDPDGDRTP